MAFCQKCGKELVEGQPCSCQKSVAKEMGANVKKEASEALGNIVGLVKSIIANPEDTVTEYINGEDQKAAYQLIGIEAAAVVVSGLIFRLFSTIFRSYEYSVSSYLTSIFASIAVVAAAMFGGAFMIQFMARQFGGVEISYNKALAIASLQAIVISPAILAYNIISSIGIYFLTSLVGTLYAGIKVLAIMLTYYGFNTVVQDKKKLFYGIGAYVVVLELISYVIGQVIR